MNDRHLWVIEVSDKDWPEWDWYDSGYTTQEVAEREAKRLQAESDEHHWQRRFRVVKYVPSRSRRRA